MFTCIDLERLVVLYRHPDANALMSLANIEAPAAPIVVMSATDPDSFERFTDYELKVLFMNICGMAHDGFHRKDLVQSVVRVLSMVPETQLVPREVDAQLACITDYEDSYQYVFGSSVPAVRPDLFKPAAAVSVKGHVPPDKRYYVRNPKHETFKYVDKVKPNPVVDAMFGEAHVSARTPRDPSAPREVAERPKVGSTTARVWDISDACYEKHPHFDKTLRALVAAECEKHGINSSTMSVQYSKWKHSKLAA